ncbi:tyrosine-protein phosphatase [Lapidilactobacillus luobeiensis]|uniref:tyrosine-protein phosphatase n=1 Tax=Lapidilactobacillus luobeiensis TaxID=2950371 RepID=UPI0021C30D61|nr:tyrosine-protein phosphatase [Lapidilactobacillus luobeiensis]
MTTRLLKVENGHNFRELGGYTTQDGRHLKYHKVIRAGHLCDLSTADRQLLTDYGVRQDVDFRSRDEVEKGPDRVPEQAEYIFNPIFAVDETRSTESAAQIAAALKKDPRAGYQQMIKVYHNLITDPHAQKAFRQFFALLLANDQDDQALLFHCTGGKDRTGIGAYLFLNALGVDPDTIRHDYLLTNTVTQDYLNDFLAGLRAKGESEITIANTRAFWVVEPGYLAQAEDDITENYGNVHNFLTNDLKLTQNDLHDLQSIYLTTK